MNAHHELCLCWPSVSPQDSRQAAVYPPMWQSILSQNSVWDRLQHLLPPSTILPVAMFQRQDHTSLRVCVCKVQCHQTACACCRYLAYGTSMDYMYERLHIPYPLTFEVITLAGRFSICCTKQPVYSPAKLAFLAKCHSAVCTLPRCLAKHAECSICRFMSVCLYFLPVAVTLYCLVALC